MFNKPTGVHVIEKIVSGGQTGVDRAALDVALELGIACGGWCPKGRKAEDGPIPEKYPLQETPSGSYEQRTEWNVRDSDGTLVITRCKPTGGTALTVKIAERYAKPLLVVDIEASNKLGDAASQIIRFLQEYQVQVVNVAGPRSSKDPAVHQDVRTILLGVISAISPENPLS